MSKLLEAVVEELRALPEDEQELAARALRMLVAERADARPHGPSACARGAPRLPPDRNRKNMLETALWRRDRPPKAARYPLRRVITQPRPKPDLTLSVTVNRGSRRMTARNAKFPAHTSATGQLGLMMRILISALCLWGLASGSSAQDLNTGIVRSLTHIRADELFYDAATNRLVIRGNIRWSGLTIPRGEIVCDANNGVLAVIDHNLLTDDRIQVGIATCNSVIAILRRHDRRR